MTYLELQSRFTKLHIFASEHPDSEFRFIDEDGDSLFVKFDTAYETDNGLDPEDDGYEEYYALAFCEKSTQKLFELNCHNLPNEVWTGNIRII